MLNKCISISESLPEGDGQFARANYKLSQIHHEQGKASEGGEFLAKARAMKRKISSRTASDNDESIESYDKLNLWMLW